MSKQLKERASKNFDYYLMDFQNNGIARMLPSGRLSQQEWQDLNDYLSGQGVCLVPFEFNGKKYMQFAKLPQEEILTPELVDDDVIEAELLDDEVAEVPSNVAKKISLEGKLKKYTGFNWEYRAAQDSGLGFEHYRLKIDGVNNEEVQKIKNALKKRAIYPELISTNKGTFLIYKINLVRNVAPDRYIPNPELMSRSYRPSKCNITPEVGKELVKILQITSPDRSFFGTAQMHAHTDKIIGMYSKIGAINIFGANNLSHDLRKVLLAEFAKSSELMSTILNWRSASKEERISAMKQMNYMIGSMHRHHSGETVINFGDDYYAGGGFNPSGSNTFSYNTTDLSDFDTVLEVLVHENVHGFQSVGRSSIVPECVKYQDEHKKSDDYTAYINSLDEAEARYVAHRVSREFYNDFSRMHNVSWLSRLFRRGKV